MSRRATGKGATLAEEILLLGAAMVENGAADSSTRARRNGRMAPYEPRSIATRRRRSAGELDELLQVVNGILAQQSGPISIRHLFYRTVAAGVVEKTERGYAGQFDGESVEIDAMPRDVLLALVEGCITQHLPPDALARLVVAEREERASAQQFLTAWTELRGDTPEAGRRRRRAGR